MWNDSPNVASTRTDASSSFSATLCCSASRRRFGSGLAHLTEISKTWKKIFKKKKVYLCCFTSHVPSVEQHWPDILKHRALVVPVIHIVWNTLETGNTNSISVLSSKTKTSLHFRCHAARDATEKWKFRSWLKCFHISSPNQLKEGSFHGSHDACCRGSCTQIESEAPLLLCAKCRWVGQIHVASLWDLTTLFNEGFGRNDADAPLNGFLMRLLQLQSSFPSKKLQNGFS